MIVDAHTHIFPASFIAERDALVVAEPVFATLYTSPKAAMATASDLLGAMDEAGVDRAAIAGFTWLDRDRCARHNDALLDAAGRSRGRLIALCAVPISSPEVADQEMARCAAAGAAGFGELRLDVSTGDGHHAAVLTAIGGAATRLRLPLLLHASEPVGHSYAGKEGGSLAGIWRFLTAHPAVTAILAHLGGGLPFYAHMPEVREVFERLLVDTAAIPWLYDPAAVEAAVGLVGADRVLFATDFPLRHPRKDLAWLRSTGLDEHTLAAILGGNAARLFGWE
ncbi:MAG: amidohydrolase family protein [Dehalococcoidia bacterium]